MRPQAAILERLPHPPVTRDQLRMLQLGDNVVSDGGAGMMALGLGETLPLDEQLRLAVGPSDAASSIGSWPVRPPLIVDRIRHSSKKSEGRLSAALDPGNQRWIWQRRFLPARSPGGRDGRRRGTRVPYAWLWRFPDGSREHASTRWYLHCRYCWNLSRPDHLLSAVSPSVYRRR